MTGNDLLLKKYKSNALEDDQKAAMNCYLKSGGRVCVDAGAGTGKTTVLIETLAETILREIHSKPKDFNPMERILVVSFGVEASRQLKSRLKDRLRDHEAAGERLPLSIWRFIESESHIQTIDAFLQSLLREILTEIGLNPSFDIPIGLDQDTLVTDILEKLHEDPQTDLLWRRLEEAYPGLDYMDRPPEDLQTMIWKTHQKMREFCLEPEQVKNDLVKFVSDLIHAGKSPPFTMDDLKEIVQRVSNNTYNLQCPDSQKKNMIAHAEGVYNYSLQLANDLGDMIIAFDKEYDKRTRREGTLTYVDIAYLVWHYTFNEGNANWKASLQRRFDHILVDEFQDTNFVQYQVISSLIRTGTLDKRNRLMFIGDIKQSIYQWRSAEPKIFGDLILALKRGEHSVPYPEGLNHAPLVSNFRSHKALIDFFNGLSLKLFQDKARGAICGEVPYERLEAKVKADEKRCIPSVHVLINSANTVETWIGNETKQIGGIVRGILQPGSDILVRDGNTSNMRQPRAGDIVLLFRRNRNIPFYVNELRSSGINCAIQTDVSLFSESEVSLVIDFLDWLANPDSRDSVTRILRSPIIALSDKTLRYLAQQKFFLQSALDQWTPALGLSEEDRKRLEELLRLREDLRWDREGPKANLIERILAHGCLDSVVLASEDGMQSQANLWMLVEVASSMEEEELLAYGKFVQRLKDLRERASEDKDFPRAVLADEKTTDSLKVMTIHAAKGLEFPIVMIPDIVYVEETKRNERMVRSREAGIILKPRTREDMPPGVSITSNLSGRSVAWAGRRNEESILWLSPERRDTDGCFASESRLNQNIKENIAEFWRLFYVVATRARDHLVFSIGNDKSWNRYEWNSWMRFLRSTLQLDNLKSGAHNSVNRVQLSPIEVHIGIEDLPTAPGLDPRTLAKCAPNGNNATYESGCPSFLPSQINPSSFPTLLECPRRYQYESIWLTSRMRERFLVASLVGAKPPYTRSGRRMSQDEWGNEVHEALRQWVFSVSFYSDASLMSYISRYGDVAKNEFEKALKNFANMAVGKMAIDSAVNHRPVEKERDLQFLFRLNQSSPPILVEGRIDLLFKNNNDEWILVDFKAEEMPSVGSYRYRVHYGQINAYGWLISRALGLKVAKAYLAYVHPNPNEREMIPDEKWFETKAKMHLDPLNIELEKGLKATPSHGPTGACTSCPYSKQVGGPCEN
jgi:ATP-dependent helicase/nuclease subunit A